ncbi:MAG: hypothetical protein ACI9WC_002067 [Arenicella sp.]|jgi:hypothetical protein
MNKQKISTLLIGLLLSFNVAAQTGEPPMPTAPKTPSELALEVAENAQKIAAAELAEAQSKKTLRELNLPKTETKGLEGKFTLNEGAGYYSEIMAYSALQDAVSKVATNINHTCSNKLIISTDFNIGQQFILWNILSVRMADYTNRMKTLIGDYTDSSGEPELLEPESVTPLLTSLPLMLGAATDLAKFFKTNTELVARKVTIPDNALLAAIAGAICIDDADKKPFLQGLNLSTTGKLVGETQNLLDLQISANTLKSDLRKASKVDLKKLNDLRKLIKQLKAALAKEHDSGKKQAIQAKINTAETNAAIPKQTEDALIAAEKLFDGLSAVVTKFVESITVRPADGASLLETVANVDSFKADKNASMLSIEISSSGGEIERKSSSFRSDRIKYLGGVVVSYIMFDQAGETKAAGIVPLWKSGKFGK